MTLSISENFKISSKTKTLLCKQRNKVEVRRIIKNPPAENWSSITYQDVSNIILRVVFNLTLNLHTIEMETTKDVFILMKL
jgi:hypothetical protein